MRGPFAPVLAVAAWMSMAGCAARPVVPDGPAALHRTARAIDVDLSLLPDEAGRVGGVSLRYCLPAGGEGRWPRRLGPENRRAVLSLVSATDDGGRPLPMDTEGVSTSGLVGCARLVVDVGRLADALSDHDLALRAGDDLIITPDLWLWHPVPFDNETLALKVDADGHDGAFNVLLPWKLDDDGRAHVGAATWMLKSDAVFGRFPVEDLDIGGARFQVARLDDGRAPPQLSTWLRASALAVTEVTGRYPLERVNVLVVPTHVTRPIVVGFFSRGGGATATFFVGEGAPDIDDADLDATGRWAITHELAHPLLPPVKQSDAWLNEGLATWHQDLLARRAGMLPDDESYWRELLRGLDTGAARAAEDHLPLSEASARMHTAGTYQHAYWAGVAVIFLAEVEAQQHGASLDDLVRGLRTRFPADDRPRSAFELLDAVASGDDVPAATAARVLKATFQAHADEAIADIQPTLKALGVMVDAVGGVHLDDTAPLTAVRKRITTPARRAPAALQSSGGS